MRNATAVPYEPPWRNYKWALYTQTCRIDELDDWKLVQLLKLYRECFDDGWWYYLSKNGLFVRRVPLWQKQKRIDMKKWKVNNDPSQRRLEAVPQKLEGFFK
jgi:hypothetical protein